MFFFQVQSNADQPGSWCCLPWTLFCPGGCAWRGRCWAASCRPRSWGPGQPAAVSYSARLSPHLYNALHPPVLLRLERFFYFWNIFNEGSLVEMWGNLNRCEMLEIIIYRMLRYLKHAPALHSTYYNHILTRSSSQHFPIWYIRIYRVKEFNFILFFHFW